MISRKLHPSIPANIYARQHEIMAEYIRELDSHLADVRAGRALDMYEVRDFAKLLHIHPTHLSNTIRLVSGKSPCDFFEERLVRIAKELLTETTLPVAEIARRMTFDPSNFTKFFKRFEGATPKQYREAVWNLQRAGIGTEKLGLTNHSESLTI
jgi:AraC family transcriptional regulator, regulatory protein of adaptative response / methylphosphotriester-DNA alkyltransferase methyltransferase